MKKILITGASGGIGGAIVKKFLSMNASVLGSGTNSEKLNLLKNEFPSLLTEQFDISQHEKIDEFIEEYNSGDKGFPNKITFKNFVKNLFSVYAG